MARKSYFTETTPLLVDAQKTQSNYVDIEKEPIEKDSIKSTQNDTIILGHNRKLNCNSAWKCIGIIAVILLILSLTIGLVLFIFGIDMGILPPLRSLNDYNAHLYQIDPNTNYYINEPKKKVILVYNIPKLNTSSIWYDGYNSLYPNQLYNDMNCENNCFITANQNYDNMNIDEFNAIIFDGMHPFKKPHRKSTKQLYVYAVDNFNYWSDIKEHWKPYFYHLTMTPRLDSDIIWQKYKMGAAGNYAPFVDVNWQKPIIDLKRIEQTLGIHARNKRYTAFVILKTIDINQLAKMELILQGMSKYIDIQMYGNCKRCLPTPFGMDRISRDYKFQIIFENTGITSQEVIDADFYRALRNDVIPVVMDNLNMTRFAPEKSYLLADHYGTYRQLSLQLQQLNNNISSYLEYMWWKPYYEIIKLYSPICQVCNFLSIADTNFGIREKLNFDDKFNDWTQPLLMY